ncbi:MAG: hypothetical protein WC654_00105 [Patescibacteria group bacterium]
MSTEPPLLPDAYRSGLQRVELWRAFGVHPAEFVEVALKPCRIMMQERNTGGDAGCEYRGDEEPLLPFIEE